MLKSLQRKFKNAEKTKCSVLATLLDPRYKGHAFSLCTLRTLRNAKEWIKEEAAKPAETEKMTSLEGPDPKRVRVEEEEEGEPGPSGLLEQKYANLLGAHGQTSEETDEDQQISQQLDQYLREPLIDRQTGQPTAMVETKRIPPEPSGTTGKKVPLSTSLLCSQ